MVRWRRGRLRIAAWCRPFWWSTVRVEIYWAPQLKINFFFVNNKKKDRISFFFSLSARLIVYIFIQNKEYLNGCKKITNPVIIIDNPDVRGVIFKWWWWYPKKSWSILTRKKQFFFPQFFPKIICRLLYFKNISRRSLAQPLHDDANRWISLLW